MLVIEGIRKLIPEDHTAEINKDTGKGMVDLLVVCSWIPNIAQKRIKIIFTIMIPQIFHDSVHLVT
ncbi:hypothetical protein C495_06163 [Natronorubrum sulfidifaciens JCM 14089]|uniref:Uncharacterized protein n=1 Tax=Natronorubrum sulfidifaciens JCM 14089 TaxID=1230460 RepID=L9WB25_9EURY|nr:hypothetical protein C495_06163 [Natronorubrum sulfidifaciens JCM 14089]